MNGLSVAPPWLLGQGPEHSNPQTGKVPAIGSCSHNVVVAM